MNIARFDQLHPLVIGLLPAAPEAHELNAALQEASRTLCRRSEAWVDWLTPANIVADTKTYVVATEWEAEIHRVLSVRLASAADVTAGEKGTEQNPAAWAYYPRTESIEFVYAPQTAVTGGLNVQAVLVPKMRCSEIAEWMLQRYGDTLVSGAVAYLARQANRPWYDRETFADHSRQFQSGIARAMHDRLTGFKNVSIQVETPYMIVR